MKKRGLSPVIATVLLVMLTITAIALVSNFVTKFVKTSLPKTTECVPYRNYFEFQEEFNEGGKTYSYNCYKDVTGGREYFISVKAGSTDDALNGSIKGFEIAFNKDDGTTSAAKFYSGQAAACSSGGIRALSDEGCTGILGIPSMGGAKTYVYKAEATDLFASIDIYPVLTNDRLCDRSDSINIIKCN